VLEVSVGTGRNLKYYPVEKCKSITLVDTSKEMVEEAKKKFKGPFQFSLGSPGL
jgi:methyltransferase OMS1, mitochondrial